MHIDQLRKIFRPRKAVDPQEQAAPGEQDAPQEPLEGDRTLPPAQGAARTVPLKIVLAIAAAGIGFIVLAGTVMQYKLRQLVEKTAAERPQARARADTHTIPAIQLTPPVAPKPPTPPAPVAITPPLPPEPDPQALLRMLRPDIPRIDPTAGPSGPAAPPPDSLADRKNSRTVITGSGNGSTPQAPAMAAPVGPQSGLPPMFGGAGGLQPAAASKSDLSRMLDATPLPGTVARKLFNRTCVVPQGSFMPCVLQTAIDSELAGMASCRLERDVRGHDGKMILIDRDSMVSLELGGKLELGQRRIFVKAARAVTPTGVTIELSSPLTDALGRGGLTGDIDNRFLERFGPAILLGLIGDLSVSVNVGPSQSSGSGPTIVMPNTTGAARGMAETALQQQMKIPPRLVVNQGERVNIIAARDLNFCAVYNMEAVE